MALIRVGGVEMYIDLGAEKIIAKSFMTLKRRAKNPISSRNRIFF